MKTLLRTLVFLANRGLAHRTATCRSDFGKLSPARIEDLAYSSSPAHIENWRGPTLLTVGYLDRQGRVEAVDGSGYRLVAGTQSAGRIIC